MFMWWLWPLYIPAFVHVMVLEGKCKSSNCCILWLHAVRKYGRTALEALFSLKPRGPSNCSCVSVCLKCPVCDNGSGKRTAQPLLSLLSPDAHPHPKAEAFSANPKAQSTRTLSSLTWTPTVCKRIAPQAIFPDCGPLFHILLESRYKVRFDILQPHMRTLRASLKFLNSFVNYVVILSPKPHLKSWWSLSMGCFESITWAL